jgi:membrane fusion protein (multidrug efflux system)
MRLRKVSVAVALAAALAACDSRKPAAKPPAAVPAAILQVAPQKVPVQIEAVGQVEGSKSVEVRSRVSGILVKRLYTEGELVKEGRPLFRIDPEPYQVALAQAKSQLSQEQAKNEQARRESQRLKPLAESRVVSRREYEDAVSSAKASEAALGTAGAAVRQAELNLSYTEVVAPVTGVSGRAVRTEGNLITAGQDSSLLTTINRINPVWVRFSVSASDLERLPEGRMPRAGASDIRLRLPDGSEYPLKGRLNFAATEIDLRLGTQQMRAEFENPKEVLLPGQFVRVLFRAAEREGVFLVPQTAVLQNEKGFFVFTVEGGKAAIRPVKTGDWIGTDWAILEGLKPGDRVITDNLLRLRPGVEVTEAPGPEADKKK